MTLHFPRWLECLPHLAPGPTYHADPSAHMKRWAEEGLCNMKWDRGKEGSYTLYWTMEKFFMALSSATPASCIPYQSEVETV